MKNRRWIMRDFARWRMENSNVTGTEAYEAEMAFLKGNLPVGTAVAVLEKPERHPVVLDDGCDEEYMALATKIGYSCPEIEKQRLLAFLRKEGYPVYDYGSVKQYMDNLMERLNREEKRSGGYRHVWYWCPLRGKDQPQQQQGQWYATQTSVSLLGNQLGMGSLAGQAMLGNSFANTVTAGYSKILPLAVLKTVDDISEKLPTAQFFVSDYQALKPDPFLAVKTPGMTDYIVLERWQEPSYRDASVEA